MERTFYLFAYDIAEPKRLNRIAKILESIGERVQDSVFEAYLTEEEVQRLLKKVRKIMKEEEDSLRIYVLCRACRSKIYCVGRGSPTPSPSTMIV